MGRVIYEDQSSGSYEGATFRVIGRLTDAQGRSCSSIIDPGNERAIFMLIRSPDLIYL